MNVYLFPALKLTPVLLERAVLTVPYRKWDEPTLPGRFSPREVVAHLADWEPIMCGRIEQCVSNPGSKIESYDEGELADSNNYRGSDLFERLQVFQVQRAMTVRMLEGLKPELWSRSALHEQWGPMTVSDFGNFLACHDVYHIEQLSSVTAVTNVP